MNYFSIERDVEVEKAGGFFCQACLVSHPASEQSPDYRYCLGCFQVLSKEAEMLSSHTKPDWIPSPNAKAHREVLVRTEVVCNKTPSGTGGRPQKDIPVELILKLSKEGLGVREIFRQLKGQKVTAMDVSRVVSGQRS